MEESYVSNAVNYLTDDSDVIQKVLIGVAIMLLSFLIIPYFFFQGYLMKILKETEGELPNNLPEWDNWGELAIDGLKAFAISLLVNGPGFIAIGAGAVLDSIAIMAIGGVWILIAAFVFPVALTIAMRDGFSQLLNISRIFSVGFSKEYLVVLLLLFGLSIVLGIISLIINIITLGFGSIVFILIGPVLNYATMHMIGRSVTNAESSGSTSSSTGDSNAGVKSSSELNFDDEL